MGAAAGGAAPYYASPSGDVVLRQGDALAVLRALSARSVHVCITSPPYWNLRDYQTGSWEGGDESCDHGVRVSGGPKQTPGVGQNGHAAAADRLNRAVCGKCGARRVDAQLGLEATVGEYVENLVAVFREVRRVLHPTGTVWLNLGDSYATQPVGTFNGGGPALTGRNLAGHHFKSPVDKSKLPGVKAKDLLMLPSRVALALQADGWWLRAMIPWLKRNAMPESAQDRPATATEYIFLLAKSPRYFYDATAVALPAVPDAAARHPYGRRKMSAWKEAEDGSGIKSNGSFRDATSGVVSSRNRRNADWWFDSLRAILDGATGLLADEDGAPLALPVNPQPFPGSHFATFAPKLVEPMLLASTSARGCCPACGASWTRTTESTGHVNRREPAHVPGNAATKTDSTGWAPTRRATDAWRAGCACDAGDPVPCVTLDPFCGSGTVGVVARKHGRHFVGIDLSAAYLELARERLGQLALPGLAAD